MVSTKQKLFISEYLQTGCIRTACKKTKISEFTYQYWKKNEEFMAELKKNEELLYNNSISGMRLQMPNAMETLSELLKDESPLIRLRAACSIINNTIKLVEYRELKAQLDEVEEKAIANGEMEKQHWEMLKRTRG